jgi:hypothetical protein
VAKQLFEIGSRANRIADAPALDQRLAAEK